MEAVLEHLSGPIAVVLVILAFGVARRIGSDDALELRSLKKENARLEAELSQLQQDSEEPVAR